MIDGKKKITNYDIAIALGGALLGVVSAQWITQQIKKYEEKGYEARLYPTIEQNWENVLSSARITPKKSESDWLEKAFHDLYVITIGGTEPLSEAHAVRELSEMPQEELAAIAYKAGITPSFEEGMKMSKDKLVSKIVGKSDYFIQLAKKGVKAII